MWQVSQCFLELLTFFNRDLPDIPNTCRLFAQAFAILFIGSKLLQPYPDNECILRLIAQKVLMNAGFNSDIVYHPRIIELTPDDFLQSLCK